VPGLAGRNFVEVARSFHAELLMLASRGGASMLPGTVSQYVHSLIRWPVLSAGPGAGDPGPGLQVLQRRLVGPVQDLMECRLAPSSESMQP
jgi:hypothetical protein